MRYDLQKEIWRLECGLDGGVIGRFVLVTHSAGRHADGAVVERTDQRVDFRLALRAFSTAPSGQQGWHSCWRPVLLGDGRGPFTSTAVPSATTATMHSC